MDVAIVGGGMQGLLLLRELTAAGYGSVLITNADLGCGQTLHSHGLLNSGAGLLTGALQHELYEVTLPYLRALGVSLADDGRSYLLAPDALVDQLAPAWQANRYQPQRTDASELPAGLEPEGRPAYRVHDVRVDKRRLMRAISAGVEPLIVGGQVVDADHGLRVRAATGEVVAFAARAVVVAAGCGTKGLLRRVFGVEEAVLDRIGYTDPHMICVRAPREVLPDVGTVISPDLLVAAVPPVTDDPSLSWYVTPAAPDPARFAEAPDDGSAEVNVALVRAGIEALVRLVPQLARSDERVRATVFAGYKQDLDGQSIRRACEVVDEERNVVMALPSVLANAVPNALDAVRLIRQRLGPSTAAPVLEGVAEVAVGPLNEDADQERWLPWRQFARTYGVELS